MKLSVTDTVDEKGQPGVQVELKMSETDMEKIDVDPATSEAHFQNYEFAAVVFHNVAHIYPEDAHVECSYTVSTDFVHTSRDWVGLYKVGWMSYKDYVYYEWAPVPALSANEKDKQAHILFQSHNLPKDDGEFYQFCYVSSSGKIRGASTPFQFKKPSADDFVELEDLEADMLVIRSKTRFLEDGLQQAEMEKRDLIVKIADLEDQTEKMNDDALLLRQSLDKEMEQKKELQEKFAALQVKIDELMLDASNMNVVHDELKLKITNLEVEKSTLQNQSTASMEEIKRCQEMIEELEQKISRLLNEKDEMEGSNKALSEKMELYREQLALKENSSTAFMIEISELTSKLEEHNATIAELKESLSEKEAELLHCREQVAHFKSELKMATTKVEEEKKVTQGNKDDLHRLNEKLRNVEDKLAAAEKTKEMMIGEIHSFQQSQGKLSENLEQTKSENHSLKLHMDKMEQGFVQEIALLKKENGNIHKEAEKMQQERNALRKRQKEQEKQLALAAKNSKDEQLAPIYALRQVNDSLKQMLSKKDEEIKHLKKSGKQRENDLLREVSDLNMRIQMCRDEYTRLLLTNRKLEKNLGQDKSEHKGDSSPKVTVMEEVMQKSEEKPPASAIPKSRRSGTPELIAALQTRLEKSKEKLKMWKKVYREMQEQSHQQLLQQEKELQKKDAEIKFLHEKDTTIAELNQKLRDLKPENPVYKRQSSASPQLEEDGCATCPLLYGNPYLEEAHALSAGASKQVFMPCSVVPYHRYPSTPADEPASPSGQYLSEDCDSSINLPPPIEPTRLQTSKVAAVKATLPPSDGYIPEFQLCEENFVMPTAPPDSEEERFVDACGEAMKICPHCKISFEPDTPDLMFIEHIINHDGEFCPICKSQKDRSMSQNDFECHVLDCMEKSKGDIV